MFVIKRNGTRQEFDQFKIAARLGRIQYRWQQFHKRELHIDLGRIVEKVVALSTNDINTSQLDEHAAETCAGILDHPDYNQFGGAILASNLESQTRSYADYLTNASCVPETDDEKDRYSLLDPQFVSRVRTNIKQIESRLKLNRNMMFDYFGMQTLIKQQYLLHRKLDQDTRRQYLENPQFMYMRVGLWLFPNDLQSAFDMYDILSLHQASFGSPTFLNAGTPNAQGASCFLTPIENDSIEGIYRSLGDTAVLSKNAGGVGLSVTNIRCSGSYIAGTNGTANGLPPMLRVFNATAEYVDQGGGKRKGSFAIYLELWHADVFLWLDLKKNDTNGTRARELHYSIWGCDLYGDLVSKQLREPETEIFWYLMDPKKSPELIELYGEPFNKRYFELVEKGQYVKKIPILKLHHAIERSIFETGNPYIVNKDQSNLKSNQQNLGTIRSSNLCTEIIQYSSKDEIAVCVLASISLTSLIDYDVHQRPSVNFKRLDYITQKLVHALNQLIDVNHYPLEKTRIAAMRHRAIAIGFQGKANLAQKLFLPFESREFAKIDAQLAELCYFAQLTASHELAVRDGPYESFGWNGGCPLKHGKFQFDLWKEHKRPKAYDVERDKDLNLNWEDLRVKIMRDGVRNSETGAQMPTASTSQIIGNYESIFPPFGFLMSRRTLSGEFILLDKDLVRELQIRGLWTTNENGKNMILEELKANEGSIQHIASIPQDIKDVFKTVWEVKMNDLLNRYFVCSHYISESTSWNVHLTNGPDMMNRFTRYFLRANELGLKTVMYYMHTKTKRETITTACNNCSA